MQALLAAGTLIDHRYRLVGAAGRGQFGQTYLARDSKQLNALCVLKEFIPPPQNSVDLESLQERFNQEAAVLFQLQHAQVPNFRSIVLQEQRFYWAREYIAGKNLRLLLSDCKAQGRTFSEAEVTQLLRQVLPVLNYLHHEGVIHRNLSPDTIILRQADQLPVLIGFGLVRELVVRLQLHAIAPGAVVRRWSYAPPEQRLGGSILPNSDLYSLAITAIVLLTGKEPEELYDEVTQTFAWERHAAVSPGLAAILQSMLHPNPLQRFASATQVIAALERPKQSIQTLTEPEPEQVTQPTASNLHSAVTQPRLEQPEVPQQPVSQSPALEASQPPPPPPSMPTKKRRPPQKKKRSINKDAITSVAMVAGFTMLLGVVAWRTFSHLLPSNQPTATPSTIVESPAPTESSAAPSPGSGTTQSPTAASSPSTVQSSVAAKSLSEEELRDRRRKLGVDFQFFTSLVDEAFYLKYPQSSNPGNTTGQDKLQREWNTIASDLINRLEELPSGSRSRLGTYRRADYDQWLFQLGEAGAAKSPVLDRLADEQFFQLFPDLKGKALNPRTFGQIWYAIAESQVQVAKASKSNGKLMRSNQAAGS